MATPFTITSMTAEDLPEVMEIEQKCFPTPWSINAYRRELDYNVRSHYLTIHGRRDLRPKLPNVLGYGGFWELGDEAHVVTLAVHPAWHNNKLGEVLMLTIIGRARALRVQQVALEVRERNAAAQKLYGNLGFVQVGLRRGYYPATSTHPREDALLLTLSDIDQETVFQPLMVRYKEVISIAGERLLAG